MLTIKPVDFAEELNYMKKILIPEAVEATDENRKKIRRVQTLGLVSENRADIVDSSSFSYNRKLVTELQME